MARTPLAIAGAVVAVFCCAVAGATAKPNSHAALECGFCHLDTPRFGVDTVKTVNFWRSEGDEPQLCERCHDPEVNFHPLGVTPNRQRRETRLYRFLPLGKSEAVRDQVVCVSCHYIHAANADYALLRGFPGSVEPGLLANWKELCRLCHGRGLEKRSPHDGDARSCAYCHSARPQPGQPATLTPADHKLCEFCHGLKSEEHYAGVNPYQERQDCTVCHGAHLGQDRPALLKADYFDPIRDLPMLNPHRKGTACFACHAGGKPGPLQGVAAVAICQRCHDSGKIAGMSHPMTKVPAVYVLPQGWPLSDGAMTCLTCHVPGHPPGSIPGRVDEPVGVRYLLRATAGGPRTAVCLRCHTESEWAGRNPHKEIAQKKTGCSLCHAADPEDGDTESFIAGVNILCLRCHDDSDHPVGIRHTVTLKAGMDVPGSMPLGTGRRITCATCHDPHLESAAGHLLRGAKERPVFCQSCHMI
ncbi:MAG: cytochrome c3 family protein [Candidatus Methylomirabilia bacterium]